MWNAGRYIRRLRSVATKRNASSNIYRILLSWNYRYKGIITILVFLIHKYFNFFIGIDTKDIRIKQNLRHLAAFTNRKSFTSVKMQAVWLKEEIYWRQLWLALIYARFSCFWIVIFIERLKWTIKRSQKLSHSR